MRIINVLIPVYVHEHYIGDLHLLDEFLPADILAWLRHFLNNLIMTTPLNLGGGGSTNRRSEITYVYLSLKKQRCMT